MVLAKGRRRALSDLSIRTTVRVAVIAFVASFAVLLALGYVSYQRATEQIDVRLQELGESSSRAAALALFNLDQASLNLIGTGLIEHGDVGLVMIRDNDVKDTLFRVVLPGYDQTRFLPLASRTMVFPLNQNLDLARGELIISADMSHLEEVLLETLLSITISTFSAGLVIAASIYVIVATTVVAPIVRLTEMAEKIEAGNTDVHESLNGHQRDELGRLERALRQMADGLIAHTEELEVKVRARTEALEQSQKELVQREKLAALGSLVAGVAHEVNTPLGSSLMVSSSLQSTTAQINDLFEKGDLTEHDFATYIATQIEGHKILATNLARAADLVKKFKQVAVDQSSHLRRPFDLREVIEDNIATVKPGLKRLPVSIRTNIPDTITLDSFPGALGQIVTNIVQNAGIHAFDGMTAGEIDVEARETEDGAVEIRFSDNGMGMPETVRERIFEPFFTTKLGQGGSGLGLNISYNLVTTLLGGTIEVASKPGAGTRFTIVLPKTAPEQQDTGPRSFRAA